MKKTIYTLLLALSLPSFAGDDEVGHYINEQHNGVDFHVRLPEVSWRNGEHTEKPAKGVIVYFPTFAPQQDLSVIFGPNDDGHLGLNKAYKTMLAEEGYALLAWKSPAQPKQGDFDDAYAVNSSDLTPEMKKQREKRWNEWLVNIDRGINKVTDKYNLPNNGFIAVSFCISSERLNRYIEYKPERFHSLFSNHTLGLFASNERTKHIYTLLIDCKNEGNPYDYFTGKKRFGYECHFSGAPYTILKEKRENAWNGKAEGMRAYIDYMLEVRKKRAAWGTLTWEKMLDCSKAIQKDLSMSKYVYDYANLQSSERKGSDIMADEIFTCSIPEFLINTMKRHEDNRKDILEYILASN